jgi:hypothetical protein
LIAEWFRINDFSKGISTHSFNSEKLREYLMRCDNFEVRGKSLVQIAGADTIHTERLGDYGGSNAQVRALYRYYDQKTGEKRLMAAAKNFMYHKVIGSSTDTFKLIGTTGGKIKVTVGDKRVRGVWGTNFDAVVGDGNGNDLVLKVGANEHNVYRVTSYNDLTLSSAPGSGGSDSTADYVLTPRVDFNGYTFIDFESWRDRLFYGDGVYTSRRWRHDTGFDFGYWVVDSFRVDSSYVATCAGFTGITITADVSTTSLYRIPGAQGQFYRDSGYCVVARDTSTLFTMRMPLKIYGGSFATYTNFFCCDGDTGIIGTSAPRHFKHDDWAYVVKPAEVADAFYAETLYTGIFEDVDIVANTGLGTITTVSDCRDDNFVFQPTEFNSGVYVITVPGSATTHPVRSVINDAGVDTVRIRAYESIGTKYSILRLHYYPRANFMRSHNDRMWFAGISGKLDEVWYSEFLDPNLITVINTYNPFYPNRGDKEFHTGLQTIYDRLYVFKNKSIFQILGYDEFDFKPSRLYADVGAISPFGLLKYFNDIYFVSDQGIYSFDGQALQYHSLNVQEFFRDSIVTNSKNRTVLGQYRDKLLVGFNEEDNFQTANTSTLMYDFNGYTNLPVYNASAFTTLDAPGDSGNLIIGAENGKVYWYGNKDSVGGANTNPVVQTWFYDFGNANEFKKLSGIELYYKMSSGGKVAVDVYKDYETTPVFTDTLKNVRAAFDRVLFDARAFGYAFSIKLTGVGVRNLVVSELGMNVVPYGTDKSYK